MHPTATVSPAGDHFGELHAVAVAKFQQSAMAMNTTVAYRSDRRQFTRWARLRELAALPASPETVAAHLASTARPTNQTGEWLYRATTLAGIRRERVRPARRPTPLLLAELRPVLQQIELRQFPQAVIGRRDTALPLMGFAGAFRRSELTAPTVADVAPPPTRRAAWPRIG